jgi:hypothetical protein
LRIDDGIPGYTAFDDDGAVAALGAAVALDDNRAWVFLAGPAKPIYHRWAKRFFAELAAAGLAEIVATPDGDIEGAEHWLRRLGFKPGADGLRGLRTTASRNCRQ